MSYSRIQGSAFRQLLDLDSSSLSLSHLDDDDDDEEEEEEGDYLKKVNSLHLGQ